MIDELRSSLKKLLEKEDREGAVNLVLDYLNKDGTSVTELYIKVLVPLLQEWECNYKDKVLCIWKEHIMSATIRTIIECCSPFVNKETDSSGRKGKKGKVVVVCPPEELHELGPRMAVDIFRVNGYNALFVGANTPVNAFMKGLQNFTPDYVAIGVSNYYNLVNTAKMVEAVRRTLPEAQIVVSGPALINNEKARKQIGADIYLEDLQSITLLEKGGNR